MFLNNMCDSRIYIAIHSRLFKVIHGTMLSRYLLSEDRDHCGIKSLCVGNALYFVYKRSLRSMSYTRF